MSKRDREEVVTTASALMAESRSAEQPEKEKKQNLFKRMNGLIGTVQEVGSTVNEFYANWIKPVYDNRMQISRRLNAISLVFSIIFFVLYIPFLLFGKIAEGLSLGREIALYVCLGTYVVALLTLLIVFVTAGKSHSTKKSQLYKKTMKVFLYVVRIAAVAISVTALVITTTAKSEASTAITTLGIVFAIVSIVFSALPLIFGGFKGFFKWLISPVAIKYNVSFVALEWFALVADPNTPKKERLNKKVQEDVARCIDEYVLPEMGSKIAKNVTPDEVEALVSSVPDCDVELTLWIVQRIFAYAAQCGYVTEDPSAGLVAEDYVEEDESAIGRVKSILGRFARKKDSEE